MGVALCPCAACRALHSPYQPFAPRAFVPACAQLVRLKGEAAAAQKEAVALALCSRAFRDGRTIVFCKTKQRAHRLKILFGLANLPPAGACARVALHLPVPVPVRVDWAA